MMKKYIVSISREDYGYITVKAESADEAREMIESGEWSEDMYKIKNGGITIDGVSEL